MKHFLMCLLYIAALGVLSFVVGRLIPKHWFHADRFPWVCHPAEQKLWKRLHVRKWQAKIPDMSRIFVKIMPEKKLTKENYENLPRMIEETCVAEWTHILLSIAGLGLLKIWSGVGERLSTLCWVICRLLLSSAIIAHACKSCLLCSKGKNRRFKCKH